MTEPTILDRFFDAFAAGDLAGLGDCLTADAKVWHGFDQIALDREASLHAFADTIATFPERKVVDVRCQAIPDGLVQQHLFVVRTKTGQRMAWPVCIVAKVKDGRIARIDEYIDRAGFFDPGDGVPSTPGFEA